MMILSIHADKISYKANARTKIAETLDKKEDAMEQCMVFFSCIEKSDEANPQKVMQIAKERIIKRLCQVKAKDVMIFPYAHLAPELSSPDVALWILKGLESSLAEEGYIVKRAPFGWYKAFELRAKGHPMAEQSISISLYDREHGDILCPHCNNPIKEGEFLHR
jgi:threonyl-tRNA synthetase